jgi:hypothetical protein
MTAARTRIHVTEWPAGSDGGKEIDSSTTLEKFNVQSIFIRPLNKPPL